MSKQSQGPEVPAGALVRLAVFAALAAGLVGFMAGYFKYASKGTVYTLTGSYGGDGAVAGFLALVLGFLLCARLAEKTVRAVGGKQATAQYILLGVGALLGLVIGLVMNVAVNQLSGGR